MEGTEGSQPSREFISRWMVEQDSSGSDADVTVSVASDEKRRKGFGSRVQDVGPLPKPSVIPKSENTFKVVKKLRNNDNGGGEGVITRQKSQESCVISRMDYPSPRKPHGGNYQRTITVQDAKKTVSKLWKPGDTVVLVVDDTRFTVDPNLIVTHPDTLLGRMFTEGVDYTRPNARGEFEVSDGISASVFGAILEFYNSGKIVCPSHVSISELRKACDYLLIPFDATTIRCNNLRELLHEVSNEGARKKFVVYLEELIYPAMLISAQRGNRECHVVNLLNDDIVDWDQQYPPTMGEENCLTILSTAMYQFFRYIENRDVAKQVMRERGLKKLRLGIEGYPTTMEKVRKGALGRTEVVYNYVQRPFIHMSWEKEEARSRHVDFQCFRSKSVGNLSEANADPALTEDRDETPSPHEFSFPPEL